LLVRIALGVALGIFASGASVVHHSFLQQQPEFACFDRESSNRSDSKTSNPPRNCKSCENCAATWKKLDDCPEARSKPGFQWGMFIGDRVLEPARKLYAQRLKQSFIVPSGSGSQNRTAQQPELNGPGLSSAENLPDDDRVRSRSGRRQILRIQRFAALPVLVPGDWP
jgi:hypothetical protein